MVDKVEYHKLKERFKYMSDLEFFVDAREMRFISKMDYEKFINLFKLIKNKLLRDSVKIDTIENLKYRDWGIDMCDVIIKTIASLQIDTKEFVDPESWTTRKVVNT